MSGFEIMCVGFVKEKPAGNNTLQMLMFWPDNFIWLWFLFKTPIKEKHKIAFWNPSPVSGF